MKKYLVLYLLLFLFLPVGFHSTVYAQSSPVMFFCERYDDNYGEVGISDRFTTGYLTVMVKSDYALGLSNCYIQFDKYNPTYNDFEYYKKYNFVIQPDMKYIYFSHNENADMKFDEPGIYRVFLLNSANKTVASALIEIIPK
jgi:hypothetical protein